MFFHIDSDRGDYIYGWILPENPSAEPHVIAYADGRQVRIAPTLVHSDMVAAGDHDTGLCGFEVTERDLPGLKAAADVKIIDEATGITIYVRPKPRSYIEDKLFLFELREAQNSYCAHVFADAFHLSFPGIDEFPQDTRNACIRVKYTTSLFVSGAVCIRADEPFLREYDFKMAAVLADPCELLFDMFMPPSAAADPSAPLRLAEMVSKLNPSARMLLSDPLTRRLALTYIDDEMERDVVAQALETLAAFDAVGIESSLPEFATLAAAVCGGDPGLLIPTRQHRPLGVSEMMREQPAIRALIGRDIEIYDAVADALIAARDFA
jgi:hypothetical protein